MKKNILKIFLIILLICVFVLIFKFSNQNSKESGNLSKKITQIVIDNVKVLQTKTETEKKQILSKMEVVLRKMAHFSLYTMVRNNINVNCIHF